ncbi:MAG: hypothetical protein AB7P02_04355 [Alphaproteobacteria bacterium]
MSPTGSFLTGALIGVLGLLGLTAAAHSEDPQMYVVGLIVALFAVAFDFWLIKHWFDRKQA